MNRFAALLDRLGYEPSRNGKLRLMTDYFRHVPDPERGYALAALTGALSFQHAKPGLIRTLISERTDPVLFELSYDYVGDLSETVALMWPDRPREGGAWLRSGTAHPLFRRHHARHSRQGATPGPACALARSARRNRALDLAEARHRRAPHRRLRPARQDRGGGAGRQGGR